MSWILLFGMFGGMTCQGFAQGMTRQGTGSQDGGASVAKPSATLPTQELGPGNAPEPLGVQDKLNRLVIPRIDFRQASIVDVIKYLDQQTIIADTNSPVGTKGVNFILNLRRPGDTAEIAPPVLTISLRNVVLGDAIRFITEVAGLRYRVEANAVIITPVGK